jgi:hypothetical protein
MNWTDPEVNYKTYQVFAFSYLNNDFGKVFICRKTIVDKIISIFVPVTLCFKNDVTFNSKFYVVADKIDKAYLSMGVLFRKATMILGDENFLINIKDHTLTIESMSKLDPKKTLLMADFACEVSGI